MFELVGLTGGGLPQQRLGSRRARTVTEHLGRVHWRWLPVLDQSRPVYNLDRRFEREREPRLPK